MGVGVRPSECQEEQSAHAEPRHPYVGRGSERKKGDPPPSHTPQKRCASPVWLQGSCIPSSSRPGKRKKNPESSSRAPQQIEDPTDTPWGARLGSHSLPKPTSPLLSIYYYYDVQVLLHQKPPSPPLSPQLQPHIQLVPLNAPPAPGCRGEQSVRAAIRQQSLHHPPPSPSSVPFPHTHSLPAPQGQSVL